jgi:cytoskeletal protein RodZ
MLRESTGGITMAQDPRYNRSYQAPYESDYASYDNRYAEPVDLDAFGSQLRSQHSSRSVATREEFLPDDSVPLFLSGADDEVRSSKFGRQRKGGSRALKFGAFAAAALIATFVAVKNPFTVFANATASLIGTSDVRTAQAPAAPPRQAAPAAVASTPAMVAGPALATAAAPLPSRDEIAVALRTAHQSQAPAEAQQPAAAVVATAAAPAVTMAPAATPATPAAPAARRMDSEELANLMTRAKALLASGDISPARLLLERAAQAQEASAALMLAQTYDPTVLGTQDIRNITPDPAMARTWYQRAAQLGSADAQRRLSQLQ